ncbi:hypothetical protein BRETT_005119 [Brettanomyces bruxellensis]|uniref:Uncharacterized protein n=1 Tax=Dekkera bruxellensis TaxID=5007 RepID=A0A871RD11_DEKBR|nr:uncharacterized protein BRETT_005119 [Brettanomyces bruxellensis]QOU20461.1 hypothetical protein BRETT_005119 [Brettanomyces bruxellensis]
MKPAVTAGKAWFCTVLSAFGVLILSVIGALFYTNNEALVGSIDDPEDGKADPGLWYLTAEGRISKKTNKNWNIVTFVSGLYHKDVQRKKEDECKQLIKVLSDEEALENIPVLQGLLINGEVGTGKSMLMNMFSESLPIRRKLRVYYSSFVLWIFREINQISRQNVLMKGQNELILFEIASNLVQTNYILMLDEFMMPDLAAARVIKIIFTYFFRFGGVLVATSNRLPSNMYTGGFNSAQFG